MDAKRQSQGVGISAEERAARLQAMKAERRRKEEERARIDREFRADRGCSSSLLLLTTKRCLRCDKHTPTQLFGCFQRAPLSVGARSQRR
jgi:hypothetical protein